MIEGVDVIAENGRRRRCFETGMFRIQVSCFCQRSSLVCCRHSSCVCGFLRSYLSLLLRLNSLHFGPWAKSLAFINFWSRTVRKYSSPIVDARRAGNWRLEASTRKLQAVPRMLTAQRNGRSECQSNEGRYSERESLRWSTITATDARTAAAFVDVAVMVMVTLGFTTVTITTSDASSILI